MGIKFANNASTNITHALTADTTSVSVTPGTGDLFPSIVEGKDYFYATLAGNNGLEIVKVTKRILDTMTIERAQDGTSALIFNQGDLFELRIVAADFEDTFSQVETLLEDTVDDLNSSVDSKMSSYLPLNGGTMTGNLSFDGSQESTIRKTTTNGLISIYSSPAYIDGGFFTLTGKDSTIGPLARLGVGDGSKANVLELYTTDLKLNGVPLLTSSGGTVNGPFVFADGGSVQRTEQPYKGSLLAGAGGTRVWVFDEDSQELPGHALIRGTNTDFVVRNDGTCVVNGFPVLTSAGGTMRGAIALDSGPMSLVGTGNSAVGLFSKPSWDSPFIFLMPDGIDDINSGKIWLRGYKSGETYTDVTVNFDGTVTINGGTVLTSAAGGVNPTGTVVAFASSSVAPEGYLLCNGATVSRTTYAALFSVIGTTYGAGDGYSTFTLPNLIDRFIQGHDVVGVYREAGIPDHTHFYEHTQSYYYNSRGIDCIYTTVFRTDATVADHYPDQARGRLGWASAVNGYYGRASTVQPAALTMRYYIKY